MKGRFVSRILFLTIFVLSGCSTPGIRLQSAVPQPDAKKANLVDLTQPKANQFVYALRGTDVLIRASSGPSVTSVTGGDPVAVSICGASEDSPAKGDAAAKKKSDESFTGEQAAIKCAASTELYMVPHPQRESVMLVTTEGGLKLSPTPLTGEPLLPQKVDVNYSNKTIQSLKSIGEGAAAGLAVAGTPGAFIGAVIGAGAAVAANPQTMLILTQRVAIVDKGKVKHTTKKYYGRAVYNNACPSDRPVEFDHSYGVEPKTWMAALVLPVVVEYPVLPKEEDEGHGDCWHVLPYSYGTKNSKWDGEPQWFYRFEDTDADQTPQPASFGLHMSTDTKFYKGTEASESEEVAGSSLSLKEISHTDAHSDLSPNITLRHQFVAGVRSVSADTTDTTLPVAACRTVKLELAWWGALIDDKPQPTRTYVITVADPRIVQLIPLRKDTGTIVFGTQCGGWLVTTPTTDLPPTIAGTILDEYGAYKKSQASWQKDHPANKKSDAKSGQ